MERPWIPHSGGGCPVKPGVLVDVKYPCGHTLFRVPALTPHPTGGLWLYEAFLYGPKYHRSAHKPGIYQGVCAWRLSDDPEADARRERYAAIFDDMVKTAPLDMPVQPEKERV